MTAIVRRRTLALAALGLVVLAVVVLALRPASAARLPLTGAQIMTARAAPCSAASIGAAAGGTGTGSTQVVLTGVPEGCRGRAATVRLFAADGTALAAADTAVTLAATTSTTVTVPAYTPARVGGVAVTVGTWSLPTTWTAPSGSVAGPVTPGAGTAFGPVTWSQVASSGTQACVSVPVSAAPGTPWRVDLHLDQRPFNGLTSGAGFVVSPWWARLASTTPVAGVVSVVGGPGYETLAAGQSVTVKACHYDLPVPAYDPALAYAQTIGTPTGSGAYACLPVTVGVSGTPQFFAGWRNDVDLAPLVAWMTARGGAPDLRTVSVPGSFAAESRGAGVVRVTPTGWDTWGVRDDTARAFQVCVRS